ncbi:helix-turn-helix domain-containing protein [Pseudonocardia sp. EV170527-09]|uniref:MmyB family transcriptional regulator n=1 Tax=Pseudonocardia sp. EV170527-09 TaxID=2603411 RepID=UPI00138757CF|nr:helix-turn-helix domain-containing protein [Pseudonocardia sp. EV170527-09]
MDPTDTGRRAAGPGPRFAVLALPEFGAFLRQLREKAVSRGDHRCDTGRGGGMSRTELAGAVGCSVSYLVKLEQGTVRAPAGPLIEAVADALSVTAAQRRHLHDLSRQPSPGTPRPGMSRADELPVTAANRAYVDHLAPALSAFVDDTWNVVYANAPYRRIYRHIDDPAINNVLLWFFFVPESRRIMVEWEREAQLTVAWLRGLIADQTTPAADGAGLLERLSRSPEFRTMWDEGGVALARHKEEMLVRDLDHGTLLHLRAQVLRWPEPATSLQLYLGVTVGPAADPDPAHDPVHGSGAAVPESAS